MSFVAYNQQLIDSTIEANRRTNVRSIIVAVVIVIVVITIALLIYFIVRYMLNRQSSSSNQVGSGAKCSSDANCPSSAPICQTSSGLCVQCKDNAQCSGSINKCDPASNSCVQCLVNSDCPECSECRANICRVIDAPAATTITNAVFVGRDSIKIDWTAVPRAINYVIEYAQFGVESVVVFNSMIPQVVAGNLTTYTVPPGQRVCAPSGAADVFITTITACGSSARSLPFRLVGQGC